MKNLLFLFSALLAVLVNAAAEFGQKADHIKNGFIAMEMNYLVFEDVDSDDEEAQESMMWDMHFLAKYNFSENADKRMKNAIEFHEAGYTASEPVMVLIDDFAVWEYMMPEQSDELQKARFICRVLKKKLKLLRQKAKRRYRINFQGTFHLFQQITSLIPSESAPNETMNLFCKIVAKRIGNMSGLTNMRSKSYVRLLRNTVSDFEKIVKFLLSDRKVFTKCSQRRSLMMLLGAKCFNPAVNILRDSMIKSTPDEMVVIFVQSLIMRSLAFPELQNILESEFPQELATRVMHIIYQLTFNDYMKFLEY